MHMRRTLLRKELGWMGTRALRLILLLGLWLSPGASTAGSVWPNLTMRAEAADSDWWKLDSGVNGMVEAIAVSGSDVYVGGWFDRAGTCTTGCNNIAKWNGTRWSALGGGVNNEVKAIAVRGSSVYVGGLFTIAGTVSANHVAVWNSGGWSALGTGVNNYVHAIAVSDSVVYVGGEFDQAGGIAAISIAKWTGSGWSALGTGADDPVVALAVNGSDVYAGGTFESAGGVVAANIAKWTGSSWSALGTGMAGEPRAVYALAVSGSDVYAGGTFESAGGVAATNIARWNGSDWSALSPGIGDTGAVKAIAVSGSDVYAGGDFQDNDTGAPNHVARWDGSTWSPLGSGTDGNVYAIAISGSDLYVGGTFDLAGGKPAAHIARYSLTGKANQTITFPALADRTFDASPFFITATASSGLPVTFTTSSLACNVAGNQVTLTAVGTCAITAHQAGNASFNPAPFVTRSFTISKGNQTIDFAYLPDQVLGNTPPFTLTAVASSGLPVVFTTSSPACNVTGNIVTVAAAGPCVITAHQAGNANFNPAPEVTRSFMVRVVIDVTVSLYRTPADRSPYEAIIGYFADAVYEMSNGINKIRNVTFYLTQAGNPDDDPADIYWKREQWPCANISGRSHQQPHLHIFFGDYFPFSPYWYDALDPDWYGQRGAGNALAHEWGHYYYGVYDEYRASQGGAPDHPHGDDVPVDPSIMHQPWYALPIYNPAHIVDNNYLNFSVARATLNGQGKTAQDRMFGASGWETLARPVSQDPRQGALQNWTLRDFYPELAIVAPGPNEYAPLELDTTLTETTRSDLHISWSSGAAPGAAGNVATVVGAQDAPAFGAMVTSLSGNTIAYPQPVMLLAHARKQGTTDKITKAGITATMTAPDGAASGLVFGDDGVAPDAQANDGLYSAILPYSQGGVYTMTITFDNHAGQAVFTELAEMHSTDPEGQGWTPAFPPLGEDFVVTATAQVTITGWLPDDHGDTAAAATVLAPDDVDVWGRVDRAGDADVFRVTPDFTRTLVVRVSSLALGMRPRIRLLAADGVTVLKTFEFQPQVNRYFLTRVDAQEGVPFYVEVTDQNSQASGGLYAISVGQPLNTLQEQATVWVYLPLVLRLQR